MEDQVVEMKQPQLLHLGAAANSGQRQHPHTHTAETHIRNSLLADPHSSSRQPSSISGRADPHGATPDKSATTPSRGTGNGSFVAASLPAYSVQRDSVDSSESLAQLNMQSTQGLVCAAGSTKPSRSSRISYIAVWDNTTPHMPEYTLGQTLPDTPALSFSASAIPFKTPLGDDSTTSGVSYIKESSRALRGDAREAALVVDTRNSTQISCQRPSGKPIPLAVAEVEAEAGAMANESSAAISQECVQPSRRLCKEGILDTEGVSGGVEGNLPEEGALALDAATVHYSKVELKAALQLMGCKARHSHKVR